jgi:hypothetical protein
MSRWTTCLVLIVLLGLATANPALAVNDQELQSLREQLSALSQRLDALEQSNQELKAENARLQTSHDEDAEALASLDATTQALSDKFEEESDSSSWTDRIKLKGDFRFRHETIDEQFNNDRRRNRIRARAAIIANVSDDVEVGLGFASGGDDPVSTNQTLGGAGSTKDINLDLAYFEFSGFENTRILGGKFKNNLYKPGKHSMLWDGDWNPEGIGLAWNNDTLFINALGTWLESDSKEETEFSYGVQAGFSHAFGAMDLTAGIAYYQIDTKGKGSFFGADDDFFGNSFDPVSNTYLYDYHEVEVFANLGFELADRPFNVFFDYVQNQDAPELDTGYAGGFKYGSASARGTWEFGYVYQDLEADAAYGLLVDSDFGGGGTGARGHILKGGYAIARNWNANFTYFINQRYISDGDKRDYDRMQLDLAFKY